MRHQPVRRALRALALALLVPASRAAAQARPTTTDTVRVDSTRARRLETVTVRALRAGEDAPVSQKTVTRDQIERRYFGQEVPLLLQQTAPSVTAYAETSNYWGYSYVRVRGIDQSRVNLSIDGIPLNDPEDQVLYFADFPDLASSLQSVQVQRGVGTSGNGTAAYAGSINFETIPLATAGRGGEAQVEGGSFDSRRVSVSYRTGLLPGRLAFYGRASALQSSGYRYHSGVLGRSVFLSGGWFGDRDIVKATFTAGLLRDTLAYLAVPDTALARDRRLNPLTPQELDRFGEQLASLAYTRQLGAASSVSTTLYRISASGNYDVAIDPDLWNFDLAFAWYGVTSTWSWQGERLHADVGVNANTYARDHSAFIRPDLRTPLYLNTGHKRDASAFAKLAWAAGPLTLYGDVQGRRAEFRYTPDAHAAVPAQSISWTFLNPKAGATLQLSAPLAVYASYGVNGREPARNDLFAGFDNLDTSNVAFVGSLSRVRPERVRDAEAGIRVHAGGLALQGNVFDMRFHDEIQPIGALSYIGLPLRENVGSSYRRGIEADATWRGTPRVVASANLTLMTARIAEYVDATGDAPRTYRDVPPLLTPTVISSQRVDLAATRALDLGLEGRYVGRSQLTNTGDPSLVLPAVYTLDGSATWRVGPGGAYALTVRGNNLTDSRLYGSGYASGDRPAYYPLPPRNVFVMLSARF